MTKRLRLILPAAALLLASCATTGLSPSVHRSKFDGSRTVEIVPHGLDCGWSSCASLGATWNSQHPDDAILRVSMLGTASIDTLELNIDGETVKLEVKETFTDFSRTAGLAESSKAFLASRELIERIVGSSRTWVRVVTSAGTIEGLVIDGQENSNALHAFKRFLAAIEESGLATE